MDIANLTRYKPYLKDHRLGLQVCMVSRKRGEYVKFEEAVEASSNSVQQLKAEIAARLSKVDGFPKYNIPGPVQEFIEAMRQLSAV